MLNESKIINFLYEQFPEKIGDDAVGEIVGAIPGLSQFV